MIANDFELNPPCDNANVVIYDANTNENIYSNVLESGPTPEVKPPVPRAPIQAANAEEKENQEDNANLEISAK